MKIGITGHTSGIGQQLFEDLRKDNNVVGYSRTNYYDLKNYKKIVESAADCNVFINNAYREFDQVRLLFTLWNLWKDESKTIINISSTSSDGVKDTVSDYAIHKAALDKASEQLAYQKNKCKVVNLKPGYVDTPSINNNHPKLQTTDVVKVVKFVIDNPQIHFHNITFRR